MNLTAFPDQVVENLDDACFITDKMVGDVARPSDISSRCRMGLWGPQRDRRLDAFTQLEGSWLSTSFA